MKILRVTSDLYPFVVGGIGIHTHELSEHQVRLGHDVTVYTLVNKSEKRNPQVKYKIIKNKKILSFLGNSINPLLFFNLFHMRNDFDIIHAHSHLFFSTNICAIIRKIGSSPLIITNHGIMSASAPNWFNSIYLKTIGKWTLNAADAVLCYTDEEKKELINSLSIDEEKIFIIPNGVNLGIFYPDPVELEDHYPTLLWIGRIVKGKGVHFLIQATALILREIPNIRLKIIGEGPEKEKMEELIKKLNLEDAISISDYVNYQNLPDIYRESDIFILPSMNEGVPKTVLEAMACGKPIVISEFSHLRELISDSGLMFQKGDIYALAGAILKLMNNETLRKEYGKNARNKIIKNYSWDNTVQKTTEIMIQLVKEKKHND